MNITESSVNWVPNRRKMDKFAVGCLVTAKGFGGYAVFMILSKVDTGDESTLLSLVCLNRPAVTSRIPVASIPELGEVITNVREEHLEPFTGTLTLRGFEE